MSAAAAAQVDRRADAAEARNPQPATPRALARRAERRERLARARDRLAAEDQARREAQRAKQEAWDAAAAAGKRRGHRPGDEPRANRAGTEPRANITDPDVRVMRNQKGYVAGYNGQAVVTADQVIVGAMLSRHPVDRTLLHPLLDQCRDQLAAAGIRPKLRTVLADSGYVSEENFARADQDKLRLLAPLAKDPGRPGGRPAKRARHLGQYPATARAIRRMRHPRGPEDYKLRARTVEPVFGQLKTCQKLTVMSRRGRKRMAARLRRPQSAEAAPAPRRGMTAKGPVPGGQDPIDRQKSRLRTRVTFQDPPIWPSTRSLCDRLIMHRRALSQTYSFAVATRGRTSRGDSRIGGPIMSVACLAEALLLRNLAGQDPIPSRLPRVC